MSSGNCPSGKSPSGKCRKPNTGDKYIKVGMPFNSLMTEFFEGRYIEGLSQRVFVHIRTQVENSIMPESGFTLNQIMHLHINFHKLAMTRGSPYIKLPKLIALKKAVINSKNNDEQCFKLVAFYSNIAGSIIRNTKLCWTEN